MTIAASVNETYALVGSCINCTAPANLLATLAVILIGVALAARFESRQPAQVRSRKRGQGCVTDRAG